MNPSLIFDISLAQTKPENIRNKEAACPFCDTASLTNILDRSGNIIWLMNKYPVLKGSWPTVIIESDDCHGEFSAFSNDEAARILDFSLRHWHETLQRPEFKSVLFFKNFGPMSGGSLRHPHSQIVGLYDYDYRTDILPAHFEGAILYEDGDLKLTLSARPLIGFYEFNLIYRPDCSVTNLTLRIRQCLSYIKDYFARAGFSYNIFFYDLHADRYYIKIVPRYLSSPLFVGYHISQVCTEERILQIRNESAPYFKQDYI